MLVPPGLLSKNGVFSNFICLPADQPGTYRKPDLSMQYTGPLHNECGLVLQDPLPECSDISMLDIDPVLAFKSASEEKWGRTSIKNTVWGFQIQAHTRWNPGLTDEAIRQYENCG